LNRGLQRCNRQTERFLRQIFSTVSSPIYKAPHENAGLYKMQKTGRFKLAEKLGAQTRHLLLMTATPHNGKEADFQLFLSLLDSDRFYGKFRDGVHKVDCSDLIRRMVKEKLVKFDGTPLFPERKAYTVNYRLSDLESALYEAVTDYVKREMGKADQLDGQRKSSIGFALTSLQRRLASSPEAIFQSLKRRRERLERRLREEGGRVPQLRADPAARSRIEQLAMNAVRQAEEARGCQVVDVSAQKCGRDITSYPPAIEGKQPESRHIEVKGRVKGASTITVTRNEMLYALNQAEKFVLAIVQVDENEQIDGPYYLRTITALPPSRTMFMRTCMAVFQGAKLKPLAITGRVTPVFANNFLCR
jgi:hypothetical protein